MTTNDVVTSIVTGNYEDNSAIQREVINTTLSYICQAIDILDVPSSSSLVIADFGSAYGQNSICAMRSIIKYLKASEKIKDEQQVLVVHNDLPTNNWQSLLESLKNDQSYKALISGRSFYEQCLPSNYLAIGYSSNSLHWLSRKPSNILNHCFSTDGNEKEKELFRQQSRQDLANFLQHRSNELLIGGILILSIPSTDMKTQTVYHVYGDFIYRWAQFFLTESELFEFTIPVYFRTFDECVDTDLFDQHSLKLISAEMITTRFPVFEQYRQGQLTIDQLAKQVVTALRVCCDSALEQLMKTNGRSEEEIKKILEQIWIAGEEEIKSKPFELDVPLMNALIILKKTQTIINAN